MGSHRLVSEITTARRLSVAQKETMYQLMTAHYDNVSRPQFDQDLAEKDFVILLRDSNDGQVCGFSTQKLMPIVVDDVPVRAIFSGDTIIARAFWGEQELGRAWSRLVAEIRNERPEQPLYWFLISKGYRTYLFLPLFFHDFYPRFDRPTPAHEQKVLDLLALSRYPLHYDLCRGLVVFPESHGNLKGDLAEISEHRLRNPHIRYFLERNPGYVKGDELACLAEISAVNMKSYAARTVAQEPAVAPANIPETYAK